MHELRILNGQVFDTHYTLLRQCCKIENKLNFKQHFLNKFLCLKAYRQPNIHQSGQTWYAYVYHKCFVRYISVDVLFLEKWTLCLFHSMQVFAERVRNGIGGLNKNSLENTT